jgi:nucleotide-binding universal stress UspA family protein
VVARRAHGYSRLPATAFSTILDGTGTRLPEVVATRTLVWITEGTWPACVDAARDIAPSGAEFVLLHVVSDDIAETAHGAFSGLLGRGRPERDPGDRLERLLDSAAGDLLASAADRLDRPATLLRGHGRVEREVVAAADGADLLVLARDGDRSRLGPHSLGKATRFIVDHAPCRVLLVWPEEPPGVTSMPPPPPPPH